MPLRFPFTEPSLPSSRTIALQHHKLNVERLNDRREVVRGSLPLDKYFGFVGIRAVAEDEYLGFGKSLRVDWAWTKMVRGNECRINYFFLLCWFLAVLVFRGDMKFVLGM